MQGVSIQVAQDRNMSIAGNFMKGAVNVGVGLFHSFAVAAAGGVGIGGESLVSLGSSADQRR